MSVSSISKTSVEIVALLAVVLLVAGSVLGQPILIGFVETGSMEPTLAPGDGFVPIPSAVAGDIEEGDVVVFRAKRLHGGGLTTHRVVGETESGYITQGDANPSTDQAADEPPVKDAQITAVALQINGQVVDLPHVGAVVLGVRGLAASVGTMLTNVLGLERLSDTRGIASLLLIISVAGYSIDWWRDRQSRRYSRERNRSRKTGTSTHTIIGLLALFLIVVATASMVLPAGPQEYGFVSSSHDTPGAAVIGTGEAETTTHIVTNGGVLPVVSVLKTEGAEITVSRDVLLVGPRSTAQATVTLVAPSETGYYRPFLIEYRYLAILPVPVIETLYGIHPWLPVLIIDGLIGCSFYLLGVTLVGTEHVRLRSRPSPSIFHRVWNRYK